MPQEIQSAFELQAFWPVGAFYRESNEYKASCPFCPADHTTVIYNGVSFTGRDRLIIKSAFRGVWCRECKAAGRGRRGNGWYTRQDVGERLGFEVSANFVEIASASEDNPLRNLWYASQVEAAHQRVDYRYWWDKCRWNKDLVDHFKLGWGDIGNKAALPGDAHLIPMIATHLEEGPLEGYYMAARRDGKKIKGDGSPKHHVWMHEEDPETRTVVITEGEKNTPTHYAIGYKNSLVTFGSWNISKDILYFLWSKGYRHLILAGDSGEAGRHFNDSLIKWAQPLGFTSLKQVQWPLQFNDNFDATDLLVSLNGDAQKCREQFDSYLIDIKLPEPITPEQEEQYELVEFESLRDPNNPFSIQNRLTRFVERYPLERKANQGRTGLFAFPPGAGKTYSAVKFAEEYARQHLAQRLREREDLEAQIAQLEYEAEQEQDPTRREELLKMLKQPRIQLEEWSVVGVMWSGQYKNQWADLEEIGIDTDLWYDFKARNAENCGKFDLIEKLGRNNHPIGEYCTTQCPLKEMCQKSGYLSQEKERIKKPITFTRHQQTQQPMVKEYQVLIIDENPTALWESTMVIHDEDLDPTKEDRFRENEYEYEQLCRLITAIRAAMTTNRGQVMGQDDHRISGSALLRLIDKQLSLDNTTLERVLETLTPQVAGDYQPPYHGEERITLRCVPELIKVLQSEMPRYIEDPFHKDAATGLHLINGALVIYPETQLKIPARIPIIVLDGTPMAKLYKAAFGRDDVEVQRVEFINPNCKTTQIVGSDFTKTTLKKQTDKAYASMQKTIKKLVAKSDPNNPVLIDELPLDLNSAFVTDIMALINGLTERHQKLLVVGYKQLREILEVILFQEYPLLKNRVAFSHYGSVRGTNLYEDWPAVLLVGVHRAPFDSVTYLNICQWAKLSGIVGEIDPTLVQRDIPYSPNMIETGEVMTYSHPFAHEYVMFKQTSEAIQAKDRIRPHASKEPKFVYVAATTPLVNHLTHLEKRRPFIDMMRPSKPNALYQHLRAMGEKNLLYKREFKIPPYSAICKEFKVSKREVSEAVKRLKAEGLFDKKPTPV